MIKSCIISKINHKDIANHATAITPETISSSSLKKERTKSTIRLKKTKGAWISMKLKRFQEPKKIMRNQLTMKGCNKPLDNIATPYKLKLPKLKNIDISDLNFDSL
mmetsp:Transcript_19257/g.17081  ORF Transcript_19257/g.17081 Transcript_19257/m.17081 type:complete len:106 (+) Transcript_19257:3-320(+)